MYLPKFIFTKLAYAVTIDLALLKKCGAIGVAIYLADKSSPMVCCIRGRCKNAAMESNAWTTKKHITAEDLSNGAKI